MAKLEQRIEALRQAIKVMHENELDNSDAYKKLRELEKEYETFFCDDEMYNGPTAVQVCYQWHMLNNGGDECVLSEQYPTAQEAFEAMRRCMPDNRTFDDGDDLKDWKRSIAEGIGDQLFIQYNAQIDDNHNLLARVWPVLNQEDK